MPTAQTFAPFLIALTMGFIVLNLHLTGKMERRPTVIALSGLGFLSLLTAWNGIVGVRMFLAMEHLLPEEVQAISFYDEAKNNFFFDAEDPQVLRKCLELELSDPVVIKRIVGTFDAMTGYSPNHEGARDRYLVRISLKNSGDMWFILGRGTRYEPKTAWVELNGNIRSGWHHGVYRNDALYWELTASPTLKKWK